MGIRFDGLASGLDTTALVQALLAFERRPLELIEAKKSKLEEQQSLSRDLNTLLLDLFTAARALDNQNQLLTASSLEEEFLEFTASSSDDSILTASATGEAAAGSHELRVIQVAGVGREISQSFASDSEIVAQSGASISIDYGGAAPIDVSVGAGGASLLDLRALINDHPDNGGQVRADLLFDGSGYRLVVSGTQPGAANDIAIATTLTDFFDASLSQDAQDAQISMLGLTLTRPSNDISDVIPGVTLHLHAAHPADPPTATTSVVVERDDDAMADKLQTLVDAYNEVREFLTEQASWDEATQTSGPLSGDFLLRSVQRNVQSILGGIYSFADNPLVSLSQIGIRFDRDGALSLDRDAFSEALDADPLAVRQLLAGDGATDGVASALGRFLEPITRTVDGALAVRDDHFDRSIRSLAQTIERFEYRLELREEALIAQFTQLESLLSSLQGQSSFLLSVLNAGS